MPDVWQKKMKENEKERPEKKQRKEETLILLSQYPKFNSMSQTITEKAYL